MSNTEHQSTTPWQVPGEHSDAAKRHILNATKYGLGRTSRNELPWTEHPDRDDMHQAASILWDSCAAKTPNEQACRALFRVSRQQLLDNRNENLPVSSGPFPFTNHQHRTIMRTFGEAERAYPNNPAMQQKAREHLASAFSPNMKAAWDTYNATVLYFQQPVSDSDEGDMTVEDTIADTTFHSSDTEVRNIVDHLLEEAGCDDDHKLIASIWYDGEERTPYREVQRRFNELTGNTRSLGWTASRIKKIEGVLLAWGTAVKRLRDKNGDQT
jgi:hypothetical protein